jgi:hypothetical protein
MSYEIKVTKSNLSFPFLLPLRVNMLKYIYIYIYIYIYMGGGG